MTYDKMLCVIPARRGSKRLPLKNIKHLNGKPMIAYTIEESIKSKVFGHVFVSTEDDEIGEIAKAFGAEVYKRPHSLAGDMISSTAVCLDLYEARKGEGYEDIICLQPSSPLRSSEDIVSSVEKFYNDKANFLVSTTFIDPHYFHWAMEKLDNGFSEMFFGNKYMKERPLLPPVYRPNGAIKIARVNMLKRIDHFFGTGLVAYEMPEDRSIHVATKFDFDMCEHILQNCGCGIKADT